MERHLSRDNPRAVRASTSHLMDITCLIKRRFFLPYESFPAHPAGISVRDAGMGEGVVRKEMSGEEVGKPDCMRARSAQLVLM